MAAGWRILIFPPRNIKEHSDRIMAVVRLYIENIQNLGNIAADIEKLGKMTGWSELLSLINVDLPGARHYQMGIKSEYIDVMGPVFCNTVRPLLVFNNTWTLQLEEVKIVSVSSLSLNSDLDLVFEGLAGSV